jgi:hypothetical protein
VVLLPFSLMMFKWRRQRHLNVIAFYFVLEKKKIMIICRHLLLRWC